MEILSFKNSNLSCNPIKLAKTRGFRLDRNIIADILPSAKGKTKNI